MKKLIALLLALTIALAGCTQRMEPAETASPTAAISGEVESETPSKSTESANANEAAAGNGTLIAYFSLADNANYPEDIDASTSASILVDDSGRYGATQYVAGMIQNNVGGDIYPIIMEEPYPADFDAVVDQNHEEADANYLPPLVDSEIDPEQYDTVFIGYPIWATTIPQAIASFLSENDLSGKTVIPFCTHDGYGSGRSYEAIAALCPQTTVLDGLAIEAADVPAAENTITEWIQQLGLGTQGIGTQEGETHLSITIGDAVFDGVLYDTSLAREISGKLPLTVSMGGFGGREYYGGIDFTPENAGGGPIKF